MKIPHMGSERAVGLKEEQVSAIPGWLPCIHLISSDNFNSLLFLKEQSLFHLKLFHTVILCCADCLV